MYIKSSFIQLKYSGVPGLSIPGSRFKNSVVPGLSSSGVPGLSIPAFRRSVVPGLSTCLERIYQTLNEESKHNAIFPCAHSNFFYSSQPIRSTTKILVGNVISMEFLPSLLRRRFARAQVATS